MKNILRLIFIISILLSSVFQEIDLKPLIFLFPFFYIFAYLIFKNVLSELIFLIFETVLILYFIYLTGNPNYSFFIFSLAPIYISDRKSFSFYSVAVFIPLLFSFYVTQYIDYFFSILIISIYISNIALKFMIEKYKKETESLKIKLIDATAKVSDYYEKAKEFDLSKFENISLKDEKKILFNLFSNLNVSGIVLFDIKKQKCSTIGDGKCDKSLLKYINDTIYTFKYDEKDVIVLPVYSKKELDQVFFFFYDSPGIIDNLNIFYYLKTKLENELLSGFKSKSDIIEGINKEVF